MRRPKGSSSSATNILLLVIFCVWCHVQPTAGGKCSGPWAIHACAGGNGKRSDTDDSAQVPGLGRDREGTYIQEGRGGDRRGGGGGGGGRESVREGDDLMRSEVNDRRRQLEERQLLDLGNHRPNDRPVPLDSALGRLRALLRKTTALHDDEEEGEEKQWLEEEDEEDEEESPRRSNTDRTYITKDTLTMLRRILDDIERRLDSQPVPDSEKKQQTYDVAEDNFYSLGKRSADQ